MGSRLARTSRAGIAGICLALLTFCAAPVDPERDAESEARSAIERGEFAVAARSAREHLARVESLFGPDSIEVACALDLFAEAAAGGTSEELDEALGLAERALRIKTSRLSGDDPRLADSLQRIAVLLDAQTRHEEARERFEQALEIRRAAVPAPDPLTAEIMTELAVSHGQSGNYADAAPLLQDAIAILEQVQAEGDPQLAFARSMYANLLYRTGAYAEAKALHEAALEARRLHFGNSHPRVAGSLNNLAAVEYSMGDLESAKRHLEEALEIRKATLEPGHPMIGGTALNLSVMLEGLGEHEAAEALLASSVRTLVAALGENHPDVAHMLDNQAEQNAARGRFERAIELYERALEIREQVYDARHPFVADTLAALALQHEFAGHPERAIELGLRAEKIGREHQAATSRVLAEQHALNYEESRASALGLALALCIACERPHTAIEPIWDGLIRSRGLVLDEMTIRRRLSFEVDDPALSDRWNTLASARNRLAEVAIRGPDPDRPDAYASEMNDARKHKERAEQMLARKSATFRSAWQAEQLGYDDVVASLPRGAALLAYVLHPDPRKTEPTSRYTALILPGSGGAARMIPIGDAGTVERQVDAYRRYVADPTAPDEQGQALRRLIWDPVAAVLPPSTRILFVVPDGILNLVSLATLPSSKGRYLIETGPMIHYLSAERELVARDVGESGVGLLALGNPRFDGPGAGPPAEAAAPTMRRRVESCAGVRGGGLTPLPFTETEVVDIVQMWSDSGRVGGLRLTGSAASEHAFKSLAPGKRIVHAATHGFFLDPDCVAALPGRRAITGLADADSIAPDGESLDRAMLLSGLVLAPSVDGDSSEDGILTAEEIAGMDLSGVEWAVLSACETGVGRTHAGEGVLGLRRAFRVAGAETLIMSLWSVGDEESRAWMRELYAARLAGASSVESVHRATLALLEDRRNGNESTHPFFWGGFVASGNWR